MGEAAGGSWGKLNEELCFCLLENAQKGKNVLVAAPVESGGNERVQLSCAGWRRG